MSKKYLSLEEAADVLGLATDELVRLREKGEIRGFADRGTWKFRDEDVQTLLRSRQADSSPDIQLLSDSAIGMEDEVGEQATVIRQQPDPLKTSDSEVKLMGDFADLGDDGSDSDVQVVGGGSSIAAPFPDDLTLPPVGSESLDAFQPKAGNESISDVRPVMGNAGRGSESDIEMRADDEDFLGGDFGAGLKDSVSDVRPVDLGDDGNSDSDVKLVGESSAEMPVLAFDDLHSSDSDVRLVSDAPKSGSDSDVKLVKPDADQHGSDSDVALLSDDDDAIALDFTPGDDDAASVLSDESGVVLGGDDSAMLLQGDSGISLQGPNDSGVALVADDDEGITLDIAGESGISLESAADSGISLESIADSGISLEDSNEFGATSPMMLAAKGNDDDTAYEIPSLGADDSEFELESVTQDSDDETAVFDLSDAEDSDVMDDAVFDLDESADDDAFADDEFGDDDLEVADDILGEDDELDDLDVFDADEDVFDEGGSTGGQQFAVPSGAAYVEQEWGGGTFAGLLVSTAILSVVAIVMFDLVNNIWSFNEPTGASSAILEGLRGLYSK
ncbi:MAG: helix-turn-helix domain-containing protein [Planctomycetaceae bacterium]